MENEFVPYDIALAMKELGFDENVELVLTSYHYRNGELISTTTPDSFYFKEDEMVKAPLYQQLFRWFREKHKLFGEINLTTQREDVEAFEFFVLTIYDSVFESNEYNTYEEAELACLKKLIEIVKLNQNKDEDSNI